MIKIEEVKAQRQTERQREGETHTETYYVHITYTKHL